VGTINPVREIIRIAHQAGAMVFIDAVHYGPHGLIDVRELDCDFLACSTYKFFGPHMGVLYGKRRHLERLEPYKVRASSDTIPNRWEWGTLNHELIAGIAAALDYLADLGQRSRPGVLDRRARLKAAYEDIQTYERGLSERMLSGIGEIREAKLYGIADRKRLAERCPTFAIRIPGHSPLALAGKLGQRGIFVWDGNYYALNLSERLDVERAGGFLRIGLVHYNTTEEVDRVLAELQEIVAQP
jgi:selenocysteine lyase/cysteine desulfurase